MSDDPIRQYTADIVTSYLRHNPLDPAQVPGLIDLVYRTLSQLASPLPVPVAVKTPIIAVRRSITSDYIVCLDCGYRGKVMRRHLSRVHGLTPDAYRTRWGLPSDYPLIAPAYSERRSDMAKQSGLGRGGHRRAIVMGHDT